MSFINFEEADIGAIRGRVQEAIADMPNVAAAYLFGSALTDGFRTDSDIDVGLFLTGAAPDSREAHLVAGEAALRLVPLGSHEFDVNAIDTSDTLLAFRVISGGMPLIVNDEIYMAKIIEKVSRAYAEDGYRYRLAVEEIIREASSHET